MAVLQLNSASKTFGQKKILENVSFQLKTGELLGVFGRNGSGKSTLLKIIFGTLKADTMALKIDGKSFSGSEIIAHQKIGYLPQFSFCHRPAVFGTWCPNFLKTETCRTA